MREMRMIDANALKKTLEEAGLGDNSLIESVLAAGVYAGIDDAPAIDAVPVVHGRWVYDRPNHYKCSVCGAMWSGVARFMGYCPDCGAKMEKEARHGQES